MIKAGHMYMCSSVAGGYLGKHILKDAIVIYITHHFCQQGLQYLVVYLCTLYM